MDERKPPFKKQKGTEHPSPTNLDVVCPACNKSFASQMGCTVHLMRNKKCATNVFAQQHKNNIALLTQKLTSVNTARNLEYELLAATEQEQQSEADDNDFHLTVDETDDEDEGQKERDKEIDNQAAVCYSTNDQVEIDLLKLLNDANTPHYLYKEILEWGRKAKQQQYSFEPVRTKRDNQMSYIDKWFGLEYYNPKQVSVVLPGPVELAQPEEINVTCFDFIGMLRSLLTNENLFGNLHNLDVNEQDPFAKFNSRNKKISCSNGASWYKNAWEKLCTDPKDFLVPIIFACDETNMGRCGACPLLFTTTLLNQRCRNLPEAWRPLGFIYDLNLLKSNKQQTKMSGEMKTHRLHTVFKTVLQSFHDAQQGTSLHNIHLSLGKVKQKVVNLKVPLFFIIGDMKGGDQMCCTSISYSVSLTRPCRKCNVKGSELGNPNIQCEKISMERVKVMVLHEMLIELKAINQKNVYSIFFELCYGGDKYGIFSAACPVEPLHSLENGIIKYIISVIFWEMLFVSGCATLDYLVQKLVYRPRQKFASSGGVIEYPRILWKNGVSNLKDLDAKYRVGILFTLVIVSLTEEGQQFLEPFFKEKTNDIIEIMEMVLCYWKWLKKDSYWKAGDHVAKNQAKDAIRRMLKKIKKLLNRKKGNGWNLPKFHEQLHVPDDIHRNGPPSATNTQPTEHNHIELVKNNYQNTQKRKLALDKQLGDRLAEGYKIDLVHQIIHRTKPDEKGCVEFTGYPRAGGTVTMQFQNNIPVYGDTWVRHAYNESLLTSWVSFVRTHTPPERLVDRVFELQTEYHRNGVIFRGHPLYRKEQPWNDWVTCQFERERGIRQSKQEAKTCRIAYGLDEEDYDNNYYVPGEIHGFFTSDHPDSFGEVFAIIKFLDENTVKKKSVLTCTWEITDYSFSCVSVEQFVRHSLILPVSNEVRTFIEVLPAELWADQFLPED